MLAQTFPLFKIAYKNKH